MPMPVMCMRIHSTTIRTAALFNFIFNRVSDSLFSIVNRTVVLVSSFVSIETSCVQRKHFLLLLSSLHGVYCLLHVHVSVHVSTAFQVQ